jgi:hypothetical protein
MPAVTSVALDPLRDRIGTSSQASGGGIVANIGNRAAK